ncbi:hypothetical protein [Jiangella gansuensis]|uniref:hypothetical protein n=1 Tax=Jiangella gansuensis TaxID=281473 RepID=UPI0004B689C9|nr:hypothetical protein [Jiangella gansuensis]
MSRRPPGVLYRTDIDPPASVPPTPVVARGAAHLGIDLATVRGGGVGGRVRLADLTAAAPSAGGPAAPARAVAVAEADVTGLLARQLVPGELPARVAAAVLLAADGAGLPAGLSVTVPDGGGALAAVPVPNATELSVAGLARAMAHARSEPGVPEQERTGPARSVLEGAGLVVHDDAGDGLLLELPVVEPAPALLIAIGAPRRQVVPDTAGGLALSVRWFVQLAAVSDPARLRRGPATALLRAAIAAVEDETGAGSVASPGR